MTGYKYVYLYVARFTELKYHLFRNYITNSDKAQLRF